MADRKARSVNIELVSRSLFLANIQSVSALRAKAEKLRAEFVPIMATGNAKKIIAAATKVSDAENDVQSRVGMVNRHFRKAVRAYQIHNGNDAALAVFQKVAEIFPDVPQADEDSLNAYFRVLGEDQDSE